METNAEEPPLNKFIWRKYYVDFIKTIKLWCHRFVEMFLATQRTYWISKGRSLGGGCLGIF